MSLLGSVCMAQDSTVCGICEESPILKWICIECDLYLCQDCYVKFHSKSKTLAHHLVMDIKEYGTEQMLDKILKVKIKEINCDGSKHCDQKCSIFCLDCNKPICSSCVVTCHKDHDFYKISEIFDKKITKLKDMRVKSEEHISVCKHKEQELIVMISKGSKQFDDTKTEILHNQKIYMDLIQKHFDNLLKDAENQWNLTKETINRELELIQRNIQQMEAQKKKIDQIFNPHKISEILTSNHSHISQILPSKSVNQMSLQQAKFICGSVSKDSDSCYNFGRLYKGPHYKMIGSYSTKMRNLSKIMHLQNSSCIIANYNEELIQKVKFDSDEIKVENEIKTKVFDLAMMPDGRLLLSKETSDLELINMNGDKELFHSFFPFLTFGVYVNKEDIFVGLAKSIEKFPNYQDGRIVVLDMKGQVKCSFGKEHKSGKSLFICPTRIVANSEIICVIDTLERDKDNNMLKDGRIVGINHKGEQKWSYCDKSGSPLEGLFYPQDITFTSAGLILASEYWDNALHAINKDGDVTGWIEVKDIGNIMYPMSMAVADQGILWVGCGIKSSNKEGKNHKIYSLNFHSLLDTICFLLKYLLRLCAYHFL